LSQTSAALQKDELWKLLVETVHALPMYKHHKRYVQDVMLKERPNISAKELAVQINVPLGEAMVLLDELHPTEISENAPESRPSEGKSANRTLLDFET
jgi:hypothetical protein